MRDHGEFMLSSFSHNEQEAINCARFYRDSFARLHEQAKAVAAAKDANRFSMLLQESTDLLVCFINFKKLLLQRHLRCQLSTSLTPTFYNHMINEAMEFYKTLFNLRNNICIDPLAENINLHETWLPDTAGHAATIACELDPTEKILIKHAHEFEKDANNLFIKNNELGMMLRRTCLRDGAMMQLNCEVTKLTEDFICYLDTVHRLNAECRILSVLKPLIPFHMIREANYYLENIKALEATADKSGKK